MGAGTMGAALAQKFAQEGFQVILADREPAFAEKGLRSIRNMLQEGILRKVFSAEQVGQTLSNITTSTQLADLKKCQLIVEAIYEDLNAKRELLATLSQIVPGDVILATNTSSFSVSDLSSSVISPERFIGLHYFYHAAKNRLVEIIPGTNTSKETVDACYQFCLKSGKDPIFTKDSFGFAINRFFVPWLNEAVKLLDEGMATPEEIDTTCIKLFGIGMGPFALMNATGVPIACHAQRTLEFFGPSYKVARGLEEQVRKKINWPLNIPENLITGTEKEQEIRDRMLGVVFFVCSQILNDEVCSAIDLNKGAKIGLRWRRGPVDMMKLRGREEVESLVQKYAKKYGEKIPAVDTGKWHMEMVSLRRSGKRAILTMNRPEDLNALDEEVMKQLDAAFSAVSADGEVEEIILTGTGKAFVAGADIRFFIKNMKNKTLDQIVKFTKYGQEVFDKIDRSSKPVIAILNGLTLGGGLELALCADKIYALPKAQLAFPETGIGIYPGLGGTQRSVRKIGKGLSKFLIYTGKFISASEGENIKLIDRIISMDEMNDILYHGAELPAITSRETADKWKNIDLFFERNGLTDLLNHQKDNLLFETEESEKAIQAIRMKAPIALSIAEQLINNQKGCASELEHLVEIFGTEDAMSGLTNIGKKVNYQGR